ncbi:3-hydroxyacyl-CoA dehydrogenase family protein [Gammaproteobacteria bacterium]|nr:3-hydroxyacyl-CoA dehydrogenase family protein [Gammaproteobacteria bacterium]
MSKINSPAVVGAGVMGKAISRHYSNQGYEVILIEENASQRELASVELEQEKITVSEDLNLLRDRDFIIEAVFEDLTSKNRVLKEIGDFARNDSLIATNTSSLLINDLIDAIPNPSRFVGVHYNNPADFNPIVEIISDQLTDLTRTKEVTEWVKKSGKHPVLCSDTPCFILNRQSLPFINEAARCMSFATPGEIDFVAKQKVGVELGPFSVMNLVGLDVIKSASRNLEVLGEGYASSQILQKMKDKQWTIDKVTEVNREKSTEITKRLRGAMIFPARDILDRKLCSHDDLDKICKLALGYKKSSVEWLELLDESIVEQLIALFLAFQSG